MTKRYHNPSKFSSVKRRKVEINFEGGDVTSDGGVILLGEIDRRIKLTEAVNKSIKDPRHPAFLVHDQLTLLRQRIYGIALGYEDLNDHHTLRDDPALQTAAGEISSLGSASTLCRMEQRADRETAVKLHEVLANQFIASFTKAPKKLILDFDATHDLVYGNQEDRHFNAFYDDYCFLPLYVFCGKQLLVSYLRPSSRGGSYHAAAVLKLLVARLRAAWPKVKIVFRADSGFCKPLLLSWCDRYDVDYVVGISKNSVLLEKSVIIRSTAEMLYNLDKKSQQRFMEFYYKAGSWGCERRVIAKAEFNAKGDNNRFIVTSLNFNPAYLYKKVYCHRGEMENRIKEQKCLFSDRTSCHLWWPNQLRVLWSGIAYVLIDALRRMALTDTDLASAQVNTIRIKLLKIGGVIVRNTRRIRIMLSSHYPYRDIFFKASSAINSS